VLPAAACSFSYVPSLCVTPLPERGLFSFPLRGEMSRSRSDPDKEGLPPAYTAG